MKIFLKKCLLVILLICILVPSLFSGFVLADNIPLTQERAGNYVATFAINFYENWSSRNLVEGNGSTSTRGDGSVASKAEEIFSYIVRDNPVYGGGTSIDDIIKGNNITSVQCSSFVAAVVYAATGEEEFHSNFSCTEKYNKISSSNSSTRKALEEKGWEIKTNRECIENNDVELQTGDILISKTDGHCDICKDATGGTTGGGYYNYSAWDCGDRSNWTVDASNGNYNSIQRCWKVNDKSYEAIRIRISGGSKKTNYSQSSIVIRGEIKTEYDNNATAENVNPSDDKYKFNNISWINFVYRKALNYSFDIISTNKILEDYFDSKEILVGKNIVKESRVLDISQLITEGKIVPGDILYVDNGMGSGEYVLYVGGTKIIYATPPVVTPNSNDIGEQSALKYEYIHNYLEKLRYNLLQSQEDKNKENSKINDNKEKEKLLTSYGVTEIYRLNREKATAISEDDVNLIFNGKGYYNYSKYEGIVADDYIVAEITTTGDFIFSGIAQLLKFFVNLIVYIIKMQVLGWANIVESILQSVLLGITGNNGETRGIEAFMQAPPTSSSGKRITVESIFFNNIPLFDVDFFNMESAAGYIIKPAEEEKIDEQNVENNEDKKENEENVVYTIRRNLAMWYSILRNFSIAAMLLVLLYLGIKIAISTTAEKKANYKQMIVSWVTGFSVIIFIHFFMYMVIMLNQTSVDLMKKMAMDKSEEIIYENDNDIVNKEEGREEINLYDAVRIKAYSFEFTDSIPATIIYLFLIYLLIRFSLIYAKRVVTVYVLAVMGPIMGLKYAFDRIAGKKTKSLNAWFKDFAFNVFLQTIHVLLYTLYMTVALSVAQENLAGFLICLVILNSMLKADKIVIRIFGLDKAASLGDVNKQESWRDLVKQFYPIVSLSQGAYNKGKNFLFGKRGIVAELKYLDTGKDNYKDAEKEIDKQKFKKIAKRWDIIGSVIEHPRLNGIRNLISKTPIKKMKSINSYKVLLGKNVSLDTKRKLYENIKNVKKLRRQTFTRKVQFGYDVASGFLGMGTAAAMAIESPMGALAAFKTSKKKIDKYRTLDKNVRRNSLYGNTRSNAQVNYKRAQNEYEAKLKTHVDNEYNFEQKRDEYKLRRQELKNSLADKPENKYILEKLDNEINDFLEQRKIDKAAEMQDLQESYETIEQRRIEYGNAKHEDRFLNGARTVFETAIGARMFEDMARHERNADYKATDKADKEMSKLEDMKKIIETEEEVRRLTKELKAEQKRYARENSGIVVNENASEFEKKKQLEEKERKEKEIVRDLNRQLNSSINETRKMNVQSSVIKEAVSEYMSEYNVQEFTPSDVDIVLNKIEKALEDSSTRKIEFDNDTRERVKKALKAKMIKDSKGKGYNKKDAITSLRTVLGEENVLKIESTFDIPDEKIKNLQEEIIRKINKINTYNEVGKVKYKQSLVSTAKIVKDAKKGK